MTDITEDMVERAARAVHAELHPRVDFDTDLSLFRDPSYEVARAALTAALSEDDTEGSRWYVPAWTDTDGNTHPLGTPTVWREGAENEAAVLRERETEANGRPNLVILATRIEHRWEPVPENTGSGS